MNKRTSFLTLGLVAVLAIAIAALPASANKQGDIVDTAVAADNFKTLVAAVQAAGLVDALKGDGPLTVFAPTDEAFAALPAGTLDSLLKPENKDQLVAILKYHVVGARLTAEDVTSSDGTNTLLGKDLHFKTMDGSVMVGSAKVVQADIETSNGVIHVIDTVLLPN